MVLNPTCHLDVACGLGDAVFNHAGVGGVSGNVMQQGDHLQGDVFGVQLVAGVGSPGQALPRMAVGCPVHGGSREPPRRFALQRVPAAAVLHLDIWGAEGWGRETGRERKQTHVVCIT